jgi:hypothetical protein
MESFTASIVALLYALVNHYPDLHQDPILPFILHGMMQTSAGLTFSNAEQTQISLRRANFPVSFDNRWVAYYYS